MTETREQYIVEVAPLFVAPVAELDTFAIDPQITDALLRWRAADIAVQEGGGYEAARDKLQAENELRAVSDMVAARMEA